MVVTTGKMCVDKPLNRVMLQYTWTGKTGNQMVNEKSTHVGSDPLDYKS